MKGKKFGEWLVLEYDSITKPGKHWICLCSCGERKSVPATTLRAGRSESCTAKLFIQAPVGTHTQHDPQNPRYAQAYAFKGRSYFAYA